MLHNPWLRCATALIAGVGVLHWMGIPFTPLLIAAGVISVPVSLLLIDRAQERRLERKQHGGHPIPPSRT
jgi:hypothetical protein